MCIVITEKASAHTDSSCASRIMHVLTYFTDELLRQTPSHSQESPTQRLYKCESSLVCWKKLSTKTRRTSETSQVIESSINQNATRLEVRVTVLSKQLVRENTSCLHSVWGNASLLCTICESLKMLHSSHASSPRRQRVFNEQALNAPKMKVF